MPGTKALFLGALALVAFVAITAAIVALAPYVAVILIVVGLCAYGASGRSDEQLPTRSNPPEP